MNCITMENGVISSTGEKKHVETPSGWDVCQVPCHTTSPFHSDTFFRPYCTLTATCLRKMAPRFGGSRVLSSGWRLCFVVVRFVDMPGSLWIFHPRCIAALQWWSSVFFRFSATHFFCAGCLAQDLL